MNIKIFPSLIKDNQTISIGGHKHAFVQLISAAIILNKKCIIKNVPSTDDVFVFIQLIQQLGGTVKYLNNQFYFDPTNMHIKRPNGRLCKKVHGAMYFLFALAVRFGKFYTLPTGGCKIGTHGARPDTHILTIFSKFGHISQIKNDEYKITPYDNKRISLNIRQFSDSIWFLSGEQISSATKMSILAALGCADSTTTIKNYYFRTDVADLLDFIQSTGIHVTRQKNKLSIFTSAKPSSQLLTYSLSDCQSETITFIALAIMCNIKLTLKLKNVETLREILKPELKLFYRIGLNLTFRKNTIIIPKNQFIQPAKVIIKQKGIQSDHQPFLALLLSKASKRSSITETVWKSRFMYANELNKLGLRLQVKSNKIIIYPATAHPSKAPVTLIATDTRASAVLVIAALAAQSNVIIKNIEHLNRGYDGFLQKLEYLGANITQ